MERILESRTGTFCIVLYALFAIGSYFYALSCGASFCSVAIIWPILPWAFILVNDLGLTFPAAMYPVFVLLNVSVAYVLGATAEWVYRAVLLRYMVKYGSTSGKLTKKHSTT
ncbi:MAG: hypothetical protein KBD21_01330 [Candidatus Pacebacteria bacterium]|nr:hypothetical protein [Candidatus Paceibacterota bacterium]